jgi:TRAP transporter 4TM/12TM fusion protein
MSKIIIFVGASFSLWHILAIAGFFQLFRIYFITMVAGANFLAWLLTLAFLLCPATKKEDRSRLYPPWYDVILIIATLTSFLYISLTYESSIQYRIGIPTVTDLAMGVLAVIVIIEAGRRLIGWAMTGLVIFFIAYAFLAPYFPGPFRGPAFSSKIVIQHFYIYTEGIFSIPVQVASTILIIFIIFGQFLFHSGAGTWFIDVATALTGRFRGGPAKVSVIASGFFGTLSGSVIANIVSTGSFTIPLMKKSGFKPEQAAAIEAGASTGGQLMPPIMGAAAFIIPSFIGYSYTSVIAAALTPAILYYVSLFIQIHTESLRMGLQGLPKEQTPSLSHAVKGGWWYSIPLIILIILIAVVKYSPQMACLYALISLVIVSWFKKSTRMGYRKIVQALYNGATGLLDAAVACAAAGIIMGVVTLTGLGLRLAVILTELSGGNVLLLLALTAIACLILGMGMTTTGVYIIVAILVAPALIDMGTAPIAAHLFVFYFGAISMITPPICIGSYAAAGLAEAPIWRTAFTAVRLGVVAWFIPFVFAMHPALVGVGAAPDVAWGIATSIIGVGALSLGMSGYLFHPLGWLTRTLLIGGGITLILPGLWVNVGAIVLLTLLMVWDRLKGG